MHLKPREHIILIILCTAPLFIPNRVTKVIQTPTTVQCK